MKRFLLCTCLVLLSAGSAAQHDLWHALFQEKLLEAGNGDSAAQYDVGSMYQNGRGVTASRARAIEWYRKAAAQDNAKAVSRLQLMEANEARFNRAVEQARKGDRDSLYDAGQMYSQGIGTEIDIARAIAFWEKSAHMGHAKSAWKLGLIHYEGSGVKVNHKLAFKWFQQSAQSDLPAAQYYLGKMYAAGQGTTQDHGQALEWLGKAVDNGFDQARGEMINVMELIAQASAPAPVQTVAQREQQPARVTQARPAPQPAARKAAPRPAAQPAPKRYGLADLMTGAWTRDNEPVTWLPSTINNCRTEDGKLVCFSYELTRQTATHDIRYKTKAIIEDFSRQGSFTVTYRHLVIDSKPLAGNGGESGDDADTYTVKTGWGSPHTLECEFSGSGALSCLKNNAHAFVLSSTPTLTAAGK